MIARPMVGRLGGASHNSSFAIIRSACTNGRQTRSLGSSSLIRSRLSSYREGAMLSRSSSVSVEGIGGRMERLTGLRVKPCGHQVRFHGDEHLDPDAKHVHVVFVRKDGSEKEVEGRVGQNLLRLAQKNDVELEGACECSIACSTCHVVLDGDVFDNLPEASEEEEDMLDQAFGLTETSRLGCQIVLDESMEGMKVVLPKATRNFYVDGHVPQPH